MPTGAWGSHYGDAVRDHDTRANRSEDHATSHGRKLSAPSIPHHHTINSEIADMGNDLHSPDRRHPDHRGKSGVAAPELSAMSAAFDDSTIGLHRRRSRRANARAAFDRAKLNVAAVYSRNPEAGGRGCGPACLRRNRWRRLRPSWTDAIGFSLTVSDDAIALVCRELE